MNKLVEKMIKEHEGLELRVYDCPAGYKTIGYGRNLDTNGISIEEAGILLKNDIYLLEKSVRARWNRYNELNEVRKAVLMDMAYNIGVAGLFTFKRMFLALEKRDYTWASQEMLNSKWANQVQRRAYSLARMMLTGKIE